MKHESKEGVKLDYIVGDVYYLCVSVCMRTCVCGLPNTPSPWRWERHHSVATSI